MTKKLDKTIGLCYIISMKKIFFLVTLVLILNHNVFSQNDPKYTIQASLFLPLLDLMVSYDDETLFVIDVEGQYKISDYANISLMLSSFLRQKTYYEYYEYQHMYNETSFKEDFFQIKIKPALVYRPRGTGIRGFYLTFYPSIGLQYIASETENILYTEVGLGTLIGYKWVNRFGFTFQLGGGVGKTFTFPEKKDDYSFLNADGSIHSSFTDVYLLDLKFGYSW